MTCRDRRIEVRTGTVGDVRELSGKEAEIRIVVADDNVFIRQGLVAVIEAAEGFTLVAECDDLASLEAAVGTHRPDVVVTDIRMPPSHTDEGIVAALKFRELYPEMGIVVLSQFSEPEYVLELFANGSDRLGYLLKNRVGDVGDFRRAIHSVADGGSAVDPAIVDVLVTSRRQQGSAIERLTPREGEVLSEIAQGKNNAAIAEALVISEKAVAKHINSIFSKLDLGGETDIHRRVKAVLLWLSV